METPYLFVYGTLMSTATGFLGQTQRARLKGESEPVGPATVGGRLYDLGRYPGLVVTSPASAAGRPAGVQSVSGAFSGAGARDVVFGEVVKLIDARRSLRWLDAYEGVYGDGGRAGDEYLRRPAEVWLRGPGGRSDRDAPAEAAAEAQALSAWAYVYQGRFDPRMQIRSGVWSVR